MTLKKWIASVIAFLLVLFPIVGCTQQKGGDGNSYFVQFQIDHQTFYIDGQKISFQAYEELLDEAGSIVQNIESALSVEIESSDVSKVNNAKAGQSVGVRKETAELLQLCKNYFEITGGKFTPALYPLTKLWKFSPENAGFYQQSRSEPSESEILNALLVSDFSEYEIEGNFVKKPYSDSMLDFGGVAKGYMVDCILDRLNELYSGREMDAVISVMSNMALVGQSRASGEPRGYNIGITNPRALIPADNGIYNDPALYMVGLSDMSVTTSADNYRFYVNGGKIYSHIIDSQTGKPADTGIISVTVCVPLSVKNSGAFADALSTSGFCMNLRDSLSFFERMHKQYGVGAVIITSDFKYYSIGLNVMSAKEFARYSNANYGTDFDETKYAEVFERGSIEDAPETVEACEKELQYIDRCEEILNG